MSLLLRRVSPGEGGGENRGPDHRGSTHGSVEYLLYEYEKKNE